MTVGKKPTWISTPNLHSAPKLNQYNYVIIKYTDENLRENPCNMLYLS